MARLRPYLFTTLFLLVSLIAYSQQGKVLLHEYKPSFNSGTIKAFILDIEQKTKVEISFSESALDVNKHIVLAGNEKTVKDVLELITYGQELAFVERKNKILIIPVATANKTARQLQQMSTLNGYVKDKASKEVLLGATVFVIGGYAGTATNNYGFYSLSLPSGAYKVVCSYVGYKSDTIPVNLAGNERIDIQLDVHNALKEVSVKPEENELQTDYVHLGYNDITSRPVLLGEHDVMRALQNVAGVQSGVDGSSNILVRGGDPGQNLNLLDGVPLYFIDHFFGVTSVYNTEAVKSVDFYKGAFPARYGGRLSSIIDVNTKDGNMERWGGQFTLGLVKGSMNIEGPLVKNKSSIIVSGRRTWIDALWRPFTDAVRFDFYDINTKVNYIINKNNRAYISIYNGRDQIGFRDTGIGISRKWGNTIVAGRLNTIINPKLFFNSTLKYSNFRYKLDDVNQQLIRGQIKDTGRYIGRSYINDISARIQAYWYMNATHHIEFGGQYSYASFLPTSLDVENRKDSKLNNNLDSNFFTTNEVMLYAEDEISLSDKWTIRPGVHWATWFNKDFNYSSIQPRVYLSYTPAAGHKVYASFTQMAQYLHLISSNAPALSSDFWVPSTDVIRPEEAIMTTVGYAARPVQHLQLNIEGYYKDIQGVTMYTVGKTIFDNSARWQTKLKQGSGWSYGAEVSVQEQLGAFKLTAAYTLSWTWRKFAELNDGKPFPYRYDRRHNIKSCLQYKPSARFDASANWIYMSGEAFTLADQVYADLDNNLGINNPPVPFYSSNFTYNIVELNNYRLPSIHRLDIGINFNKQKGAHMVRTWSFGIFNAYARRNVMMADLQTDQVNGGIKLVGKNFLNFIPYVSYSLKF
jgi:outer membrane receptor for ferrienterochelin and colicin